jgi:homoserine kinase
MFEIKTPATSANMGSGFDCIGMAFQLYNTLWVEESDEKLQIDIRKSIAADAEYSGIPTDETNLIYRSMCDFYAAIHQTMPGVHLIQSDEIPLTRGLGSSAACIVAGLLAANALSGAGLDRHELVQMAAALEGHPDNVAPAILGGVVVGAMCGKQLDYCRFPMPAQLRFALLIPNFQLPTSQSRKALPVMVTREDAVFNVSRAALLIAALQTGRFDLLKTAMQER